MLNYLLIGGLIIGFGFLVGKGTHLLRITGVIGYIITGILVGPDVLNLVSLSNTEIETITNIALGFVAFIIGGELTLSTLKKTGKNIIAIIIGESLGAFLLVLIGLYLLTQNLAISIIFAAMAPASAPAGIIAVIHEYKAKGKLTNAILMVVGFDDGLAVLIYAFSMAAAGVLISGNLSVSTLLFSPLYDIGGALLGRIARRIIFLCAPKTQRTRRNYCRLNNSNTTFSRLCPLLWILPNSLLHGHGHDDHQCLPTRKQTSV